MMTHRYYDAGKGRFINRDPIGAAGGINLYGFVGNNPVTEIDPDGTDAYVYTFYGLKNHHGARASIQKGFYDLVGTHAMAAFDSPIGPITVSFARTNDPNKGGNHGWLTIRPEKQLHNADAVYPELKGQSADVEAFHIDTTTDEDKAMLGRVAGWIGMSGKQLLHTLTKDGEWGGRVKGFDYTLTGTEFWKACNCTTTAGQMLSVIRGFQDYSQIWSPKDLAENLNHATKHPSASQAGVSRWDVK